MNNIGVGNAESCCHDTGHSALGYIFTIHLISLSQDFALIVEFR